LRSNELEDSHLTEKKLRKVISSLELTIAKAARREIDLLQVANDLVSVLQ